MSEASEFHISARSGSSSQSLPPRPPRTVTMSARDYQRLCRAARHSAIDSLTGTLTRYRLRELLAQVRRNFQLGREPAFGFVFIDLQGFKRLNDRRGQARGDEALADFGRQLQGTVKRTDFVARIGGDEFILVLRDVSNEEVLRRIMHRLEGPYMLKVGRRRVRLRAYVVGRVATPRNIDRLEPIVFRLLVREKRARKLPSPANVDCA